ncbi:coproporphyrinogen III oxidase [Cytobacillus sp. Hz8]|uniref:coproporphyrinogen III oxidase n=1 Tax=Cytobacillus sp. Hz8 TaxID=3347168 RepID=UPI0035DEFA5C
MRIMIRGLLDERLKRPLQLIANLFFEESEIFFETLVENPDFIIQFQLEVNERIKVKAELNGEGQETKISEMEKAMPFFDTEKQRFNFVKNTIANVYLAILQEATGITQKWGILTGVRPTKLLHKKIKAGISKKDAHQQLKADYQITDEKIDLMQQIVERQLTVVPDLYRLRHEVSIYIGIPFCPTKCAYCTFPAYAINGRQGSVASFLGGLHYEMRQVGKWLKDHHMKITTIYFGGGTPTSISAEEMDLLYEEMYESFPDVKNVREITVEAGRPDTITPEKLAILKKWNIDRISINPQSYIQDTLKAIGRHHTVEETIEKYHLARTMGMNNINMDLIIGLPGEGVNELNVSLNETEKLMPESLTVHTLSFKRASEMTQHRNQYKVAERSEVEKMMSMAQQWTKDHEYVPYYLYRQKNILGNLENVGYSKRGNESIYNIIIMEEVQSIIGLGCGAASKFIDPASGKIMHFANPKNPKTYNDSFEKYTSDKVKILEELFKSEGTLS